MAQGLIGKKIGMTSICTEEGKVIPVTVIQAGPCTIVQKKTENTDGYDALQLGFETVEKEQRVNKPIKGHFKKNNLACFKQLKEFHFPESGDLEVGKELDVTLFQEGENVIVTGKTKGRGFTGPIKRWNMHRGPETHGSRHHRRPGAQGQCADPARVFKGKHGAGRYGNEQMTVKNLEVIKVLADKHLLLVKGSIPGPRKGYVVIRKK